jgi:hypothetical protein
MKKLTILGMCLASMLLINTKLNSAQISCSNEKQILGVLSSYDASTTYEDVVAIFGKNTSGAIVHAQDGYVGAGRWCSGKIFLQFRNDYLVAIMTQYYSKNIRKNFSY